VSSSVDNISSRDKRKTINEYDLNCNCPDLVDPRLTQLNMLQIDRFTAIPAWKLDVEVALFQANPVNRTDHREPLHLLRTHSRALLHDVRSTFFNFRTTCSTPLTTNFSQSRAAKTKLTPQLFCFLLVLSVSLPLSYSPSHVRILPTNEKSHLQTKSSHSDFSPSLLVVLTLVRAYH
jgi:hypothetical protein